MKNKIVFLSILAFFAVTIKIFSMFPDAVEKYYSRILFKWISYPLNKVTSLMSFSLAEIILILFFIFLIAFPFLFGKNILMSLKSNTTKTIFNGFYSLVCLCFVAYIVFMMLWGLNYYRKPIINFFNEIVHLNVRLDKEYISEEDIYKLAEILIKEANELKESIDYKEENSFKQINEITFNSYNNVFNEFVFLRKYMVASKPIFMSKLFSIINITGMYVPYTTEANVNKSIPNFSLPFTIAHEMSHQAGIAYEDEANFLAYVATSKSENVFVKYSASFETMLYTLSEINKYEINKSEKYKNLVANISDKVKNDILIYNSYWAKYDTQVAKVSSKVNDAYLKANNQVDGIKSYSRVVTLLVYYKLYKKTIV